MVEAVGMGKLKVVSGSRNVFVDLGFTIATRSGLKVQLVVKKAGCEL